MSDISRRRITPTPETNGDPIVFRFRQEGVLREGFAIYWNDAWVAYENRCKHLPLTLDYGDRQFFNAAKERLICQTHGAEYSPRDGKCVAGPCLGAYLSKLPVESQSDGLYLVGEEFDDAQLL